MIGRRLSQEEAKRLLAKFCLRNLCGGNFSGRVRPAVLK
jgi:hypothetical protein